MIETIIFNGYKYPKFQAEGFAAQWVFPFAKRLCTGNGYDIGYGKPEWKLPGAVGVDMQKFCGNNGNEVNDTSADAMNLPKIGENVDYIFSSHCLEHLPDWVGTLEYWKSVISSKGILFLYLPHSEQEYWLPWNNRKHLHCFHPTLIEAYLEGAGGWTNIFVSQRDLNHSFIAIAERV